MKKILEAEYKDRLEDVVQKFLEENLPDYTRNLKIIIEILPDEPPAK